MPGPEGAVGWAGGLLAASLSSAPSNRAVCNGVEAHTPRAGAARAKASASPSDPHGVNTQESGRRRRPRVTQRLLAACSGLRCAAGLGRRATGDGAWGTWATGQCAAGRTDEAGWRIHSWRCGQSCVGGQGPRQQSCHRVPELLPTACSSHRARWAGPASWRRRATLRADRAGGHRHRERPSRGAGGRAGEHPPPPCRAIWAKQ